MFIYLLKLRTTTPTTHTHIVASPYSDRKNDQTTVFVLFMLDFSRKCIKVQHSIAKEMTLKSKIP